MEDDRLYCEDKDCIAYNSRTLCEDKKDCWYRKYYKLYSKYRSLEEEYGKVCNHYSNMINDNITINMKYYDLFSELYSFKTENKKLRKANEEKNNFLEMLGISSTGEFHRIKYYIDKLIKENTKEK